MGSPWEIYRERERERWSLGGNGETGIVSCSLPGVSSSSSRPLRRLPIVSMTSRVSEHPSHPRQVACPICSSSWPVASTTLFTPSSPPRHGRPWCESSFALAAKTAVPGRSLNRGRGGPVRCACFPWGRHCDVRHSMPHRLSHHYQSPIRNSPRAPRPPTFLFCTPPGISGNVNAGHNASQR